MFSTGARITPYRCASKTRFRQDFPSDIPIVRSRLDRCLGFFARLRQVGQGLYGFPLLVLEGMTVMPSHRRRLMSEGLLPNRL